MTEFYKYIATSYDPELLINRNEEVFFIEDSNGTIKKYYWEGDGDLHCIEYISASDAEIKNMKALQQDLTTTKE